MKTKSISLIIGLMTVALLGVMGMQLYFFRESYELQRKLFDQSVLEALSNVVQRIEKNDANKFLEKKAEDIQLPSAEPPKNTPILVNRTEERKPAKRKPRLSDARYLARQQHIADSIFQIRDSLFRVRYPNALVFNDALTADELKNMEFNLRVDVFQYIDDFGQIREQTRQTISRALNGSPVPISIGDQHVQAIRDSVRQYLVIDPIEGTFLRTIPKPKITQLHRREASEENQQERVEKVKVYLDGEDKKQDVFSDLYKEYRDVNIPLNERIHPQTLDSMLRVELHKLSIFSDYEYKVTSSKRDSLIFRRASEKTLFLPDNSYQTPLFPKDMIRDPGIMTVTFPNKDRMILSHLTAMMGLSGGLLVVLVFCFGYTLHMILRQKKISEMKTDFINNMTHEFKTPVSTIMIASDALRDPEISSDKGRIERLASIIYDENARLGSHIERVLNIAKIDNSDLKLEHKEVEINDLLTAIVDSMALQLQKRSASVELELNAEHSVVMGDELHLSNVIFNLLDNANKYSPGQPQIKVCTFNTAKNLMITVSDKGMGMSRDQLSKIFDQFYRISTGNIHDVKGFGLGLSYVSNIIKRLHGTISVNSEKGKGSIFEISLPLKRPEN